MLLTITNTAPPATDLGYLLHKAPDRVQQVDLGPGVAHVFYPEATEGRCTAALLLDLDPIALVRGRPGQQEGGLLDQYVNDRSYVASSFLSVAIARAFGSALKGRSREREELAGTPLPLRAGVTSVACGGDGSLVQRLFEPLGYEVSTNSAPLNARFPEWGRSPYCDLELAAEVRLCDLLTHLYVLLPVLDDQKHYWVGDDEVEKLLRFGEGWLTSHPERDLIALRYLRHRRSLAEEALARLAESESAAEEPEEDCTAPEALRFSLASERVNKAIATLRTHGARRVLDLGCGDGKLLKSLLAEPEFTQIVGVDVSCRALAAARRRLGVDRLPPLQQERITLMQGSLVYRDTRLAGYDAACAMEVLEHLEPSRLPALERALFRDARPPLVIVSTPNREYNQLYEGLPPGALRHPDHRFEWTREEFRQWCDTAASRHGYSVTLQPVGAVDESLGAPTQVAVFERLEGRQ